MSCRRYVLQLDPIKIKVVKKHQPGAAPPSAADKKGSAGEKSEMGRHAGAAGCHLVAFVSSPSMQRMLAATSTPSRVLVAAMPQRAAPGNASIATMKLPKSRPLRCTGKKGGAGPKGIWDIAPVPKLGPPLGGEGDSRDVGQAAQPDEGSCACLGCFLCYHSN